MTTQTASEGTATWTPSPQLSDWHVSRALIKADPTIRQRFERKYEVTPSGCWQWTSPLSNRGYGRMYVRGGSNAGITAHRISYELHVGEIPNGIELDHLCRNRACVNPAHLEPVTGCENSRRGKGSRLSLKLAAEIRADRARGMLNQEIADKYNVGRSTIVHVLKGRTWKENVR